MNQQTELIFNKNWDILIILDACRYDIFRKYCWDYLGDGWLRKLYSPGTWTVGWLLRTFRKKEMKDVIYISSNPYINSKDLVTPFKSKGKFCKVVDVCGGGFDTLYTFLSPIEVNKFSFVTMDLNRDKKFIIHYMQPHEPYFLYGDEVFKSKFNIIRRIIFEFLSDRIVWTVLEKLNFPPGSYMENIWRKFEENGIKIGYEDNLKIVLESVNLLIKKYPKKRIVITADHGERLGERGRFSHGGRRDRWVTEIPWFVVGEKKWV